jgi:hypothetical protein
MPGKTKLLWLLFGILAFASIINIAHSLFNQDPLHRIVYGKQFDTARAMQKPWAKVVDAVVKKIVQTLPQQVQIHSMYVRGSVAAGTARDGTSDIDLVVVYKVGFQVRQLM